MLRTWKSRRWTDLAFDLLSVLFNKNESFSNFDGQLSNGSEKKSLFFEEERREFHLSQLLGDVFFCNDYLWKSVRIRPEKQCHLTFLSSICHFQENSSFVCESQMFSINETALSLFLSLLPFSFPTHFFSLSSLTVTRMNIFIYFYMEVWTFSALPFWMSKTPFLAPFVQEQERVFHSIHLMSEGEASAPPRVPPFHTHIHTERRLGKSQSEFSFSVEGAAGGWTEGEWRGGWRPLPSWIEFDQRCSPSLLSHLFSYFVCIGWSHT